MSDDRRYRDEHAMPPSFVPLGMPDPPKSGTLASIQALKAQLASLTAERNALQKAVAERDEAVAVGHSVGFHSRDEEVRGLEKERDALRAQVPRWVACADRYPDDTRFVAAYSPERLMCFQASWDGTAWTLIGQLRGLYDTMPSFTHWTKMPTMAPPPATDETKGKT